MEPRERVMSVLAGELPDRVPLLVYSSLLPRGSFERKVRNIGVGLDIWCNVYKESMPNVVIEGRTYKEYAYTIYKTPLGKVSIVTRTGLRFQLPGGSWVVEYPVKNIEDISVLKFIVDDIIYEPDYENFKEAEETLGDDGIVTTWADYTPLMKIIIRYMGLRNYSLIYRRRPEVISDLVEVIDRKYAEMHKIIASSPAKIVRVGDNMDGVFISPNIFEKYCLPYYNKYAAFFKDAGKIVISHMDGRLKVLKEMIAKTKLDAIEAFTPPPMGDLGLKEARAAWKDKIIWINFPEAVFLWSSEEIKKFTLRLLEESAPGEKFIISITEDSPPQHFTRGVHVLASTIQKYGNLPISSSLAKETF
jgi:hypothetical protein